MDPPARPLTEPDRAGTAARLSVAVIVAVTLASGPVLGVLAAALTDAVNRAFAVAVGAAGGLGLAFVALAQQVLFHYGPHVLPVVQTLSETLRRVLVRMTV